MSAVERRGDTRPPRGVAIPVRSPLREWTEEEKRLLMAELRRGRGMRAEERALGQLYIIASTDTRLPLKTSLWLLRERHPSYLPNDKWPLSQPRGRWRSS